MIQFNCLIVDIIEFKHDEIVDNMNCVQADLDEYTHAICIVTWVGHLILLGMKTVVIKSN